MASWRDLLKEIISNHGERDRLANEIGVNPLTLTRWAIGETEPRQQNLQQLLQALPTEHRTPFFALLQEEHSGFTPAVLSASSAELPIEFVRRVLETRATAPDSLRFWTITRQVLQHALRQLDPERLGMAITVVSCMPPASNGEIRSLREREGQGTPPWKGDLSHYAIFLGAGSLAGHAVTTGHWATVQNLAETGLIPAYRTEYEVSAMAAPFLYSNRIAGCLLLSSRQIGYFAPQTRQQLVADYVQLLALAFEPEEFYPLDRINLQPLPSAEVQRRYFASFQRRVIRLMQEQHQLDQLSHAQAEQLVWRQLEDELITYAASSDEAY
jgi:transcriptional regulator with XRE-family HTH domain